jgi:NadR type nicotinamide-nucleotide adenylyltransferase
MNDSFLVGSFFYTKWQNITRVKIMPTTERLSNLAFKTISLSFILVISRVKQSALRFKMKNKNVRAKTGMVLGKFMPPHRGHQHLIDFALKHVEELSILVCSLEREPIPGELRFEWMRELYPQARVFHITDENPSEPREHTDFWNIWTSSIRRALPVGPDLVFTSEDYGDELARRLEAKHIAFDKEREQVPISATQIRENPYAHWEFIPSCARAFFVRRVCIVGPESTGKTTLARQLAEHFKTVWTPEYARGLLDQKGAECEFSDIPLIAEGQLRAEGKQARAANKILFCDTDLITTTIWSKYLFNECPAWIEDAANKQRYDLTLLTDIDIPWVADPQRPAPHLREHFLALFKSELEKRGRDYVLISGLNEERLLQAIRETEKMIGEEK